MGEFTSRSNFVTIELRIKGVDVFSAVKYTSTLLINPLIGICQIHSSDTGACTHAVSSATQSCCQSCCRHGVRQTVMIDVGH